MSDLPWDNPAESALSDLQAWDCPRPVMLINNPLDFPEAIGYAVARADEGLLLIPYSEVTVNYPGLKAGA